jgi:Fe-S cluster assembly ATP-binding protein
MILFLQNQSEQEYTMKTTLTIQNLHARSGEKEILHGVSLEIVQGEVHAIMGPNGSGKSTLSQVIFGHPAYEVPAGDILLNGESILDLSPDKRAQKGLFLAFQSPQAVPGVKIATALKQMVNGKRRALDPKDRGLKIREYRELLQGTMSALQMDQAFADRYLNHGFSGGEKKKSEILQMAMLKPQITVLDEIDSGLDVDALRIVSENVMQLKEQLELGILIITHYPRILNYIKPDKVHVLLDGRLVSTGNQDLAHMIEDQGYDWLRTATASTSSVAIPTK